MGRHRLRKRERVKTAGKSCRKAIYVWGKRKEKWLKGKKKK